MSAVSDLAAKLYDPTNQFWSVDELADYIVEGLRTWNALTNFWRSSFSFALTPNTWWHDLTQQTGTIRPYPVTDRDLMIQIERHLLEPPTTAYPLVWSGSGQFAVANILGNMAQRRDEALSTTGCTITRQLVDASTSSVTALLPDNTVDIRRVTWLPTFNPITWDGSYPLTWDSSYPQTWDDARLLNPITLRQSDDWAEQSYNPGYTTDPSRPPSTWRQSTQAALSFDVDVIPPTPGFYEVLSVNAGLALSTTEPTLLGIPDDWCWIVKWGVLCDLLEQESNAKDALRAEYCSRRFNEGCAILSKAPALLAVRLNNIPFMVDSVRNGDDFDPRWQASSPGSSTAAYVAGLNLVGFGPQPASTDTATVSVVENAPIPSSPLDPLQVSRDDYGSVMDYAQHLAAFKMGGEEFARTIPLYQGFMRRAALYNSKLSELGDFQRPMYEISTLEQERNPVYGKLTPANVDSNG